MERMCFIVASKESVRHTYGNPFFNNIIVALNATLLIVDGY
jgi:hypothetical protein